MVGLVGQDDAVWTGRDEVGQFGVGITGLPRHIDQLHADAPQHVGNVGVLSDADPRIPPHRDDGTAHLVRPGLVPLLIGIAQPLRSLDAEPLHEKPRQAGDRLGYRVDPCYPHRHTGVPQQGDVVLAVLLLIGDDQIWFQVGDGCPIRILRPPDSRHLVADSLVQVGRPNAVIRASHQSLRTRRRNRLGD